MAELQEIEVIVSADGMVRIRVQGVMGQKCLAVTEDLEKILGSDITDRIFTDEYDQQPQEIEQSVELSLKIT